jgi:hypothetical protein
MSLIAFVCQIGDRLSSLRVTGYGWCWGLPMSNQQKIIKRSHIEALIGEALGRPGMLMKTQIANAFPGLNPLAYVWGRCRTYGAFAKDGMDADNGGLLYADVVTVAPKTLGDFEKKCIEPWYTKNGWRIGKN